MAAKRVRSKSPRVAALLRIALRRADMSITELGEKTGLKRNAGAFVRGEVTRIAADQANSLVTHLPITMTELLEAYGFNIDVSPQRRVPDELAEAWAVLPEEVRIGLLGLVREAARQTRAAGGSAA